MAKIETFSCDICKLQKKDTNNWWKVFLILEGRTVIGAQVLQWDAVPLLHTNAALYAADAHLCGVEHLLSWLSKNVLAAF